MRDRWEYRPKEDLKAAPQEVHASSLRRFLLVLVLLAVGVLILMAVWPTGGRKSERPEQTSHFAPNRQDTTSPAPRQPPVPDDYEGIRDEALGLAIPLLDRYPQTPEAYGLLAWLYQRFGDTDEAADCWKQCIERLPEYPEAYYRLGRYAKEEGRDEEALQYLEKAFALAPNQLPGLHAQLGETLMNLGRMDEAVAVLEDNLDVDAASPFRLLALGHAYLQARQYEKAKDCFARTIEKAPDLTHAYYGLATACARLGQADESRQTMKEFQERKSDDLVTDRADLKSDDIDSLRLAPRRRPLNGRHGTLPPARSGSRQGALAPSGFHQSQRNPGATRIDRTLPNGGQHPRGCANPGGITKNLEPARKLRWPHVA